MNVWSDLERGFQTAFEAAWCAYKSGSIPIGACIINESGEVVAIGRNQICSEGGGPLFRHKLAHAEINAILQVGEKAGPNPHPNIRKYTLYTVMEPCPLCFGAIVMGNIRRVKFAARDGIAGSTSLNKASDYITTKNILVEGPFKEAETVHLAIQSCYELQNSQGAERLLDCWAGYCPDGVELGRRLAKDGTLKQFVRENWSMGRIYDFILGCL